MPEIKSFVNARATQELAFVYLCKVLALENSKAPHYSVKRNSNKIQKNIYSSTHSVNTHAGNSNIQKVKLMDMQEHTQYMLIKTKKSALFGDPVLSKYWTKHMLV